MPNWPLYIQPHMKMPMAIGTIHGGTHENMVPLHAQACVYCLVPLPEHEERMRRAAKLLAVNTEISVKEVATLTGFSDPNYFSKVVRRFFGASPTEFRTTGMYATQTIGTDR